MGEYELYIWSAFGTTFALLILNAVRAHFLHKNLLKNLESLGENRFDAN